MTKLLFMAVAALIGHCLAFAQNAPAGLTFQGRLTTLSGQPVANGTAKVRVRIFDAPTGGNRLWTSGEGPGQEKTVSVRNGVFAMVLSQGFNSSNNPLTIGPDVFQGGVIYVEVAPLNQPPILPRTQIWSAPWAFWAQTVSNDSITSSKLATDSQSISKITGNNLYVDAGNLGIGFPNPSHTLSMRNLSDSPISNYVRITDFSASGVNRTTLQIQRVEDLGFSISSNTSPLYLGSSQTGVPDTRDITIRAGNVGIGSTSPTQKLDVAGNMALTGLSGNWLYGGARLHIQSLGDKLFLNPNDSKPVWIGGGTGNSDLTITGSLLLTPSERVAMRQGEAGELQINSTGEWPYVWMGSRLVANNDIESLSGNILTSSSDHFIGSKTGSVYLQAGVGGTAGTLFLNPFTEGKVVVGPNRTQGNVGF
ncbi:MAG: hypothetical protein JNM34_11325, partial [Chthonomonadaceae bacterium]|nr:hypothetical protein [Chthonomonadaceae bacterium]